MVKSLNLLLTVLVTALLAACSGPGPLPMPPPPPTPATPVLYTSKPHMSQGMYVCPIPVAATRLDMYRVARSYQNAPQNRAASRANLSKALCMSGIQLYRAGNVVYINVPSDSVFEPHSADMEYHAQPTMNMLATFIKGFGQMPVELSGYADNVSQHPERKTLTQQQAENLKTYLWGQGVKAVTVHAQGYGESNQVGNSKTQPGNAANRRMELRFVIPQR